MRTAIAAALACGSLLATALLGTSTGTASAPVGSAVPGELIVGFEPNASRTARLKALAAVGGRAKPLSVPGVKLVDIRGGLVEPATQALEKHPGVDYAEPNYIRTTRGRRNRSIPDDPKFPAQWGMRAIRAPAAWTLTRGSRAVTIAVVDDGVDYTHRDLAKNMWRNRGEYGAGKERNGIDDDRNGFVDDSRGWDFADGDKTPKPDRRRGGADPHGTHIAGVIGAVGDNRTGVAGVNWKVRIMPLRVFGRNGVTTTAKIVNAMAYAGRHGVTAINASFGGPTASRAEHAAIALFPRTLFVVAAPNDGINIDIRTDFPCAYELPNIICVTAMRPRGNLSSSAAFGRLTVDLAAPGDKIISTVPGGFQTMTGTSMAAPHVSGAVGLLAAARPGLSGGRIRNVLMNTARKPDGLQGLLSAGRLDVRRALGQVLGK